MAAGGAVVVAFAVHASQVHMLAASHAPRHCTVPLKSHPCGRLPANVGSLMSTCCWTPTVTHLATLPLQTPTSLRATCALDLRHDAYSPSTPPPPKSLLAAPRPHSCTRAKRYTLLVRPYSPAPVTCLTWSIWRNSRINFSTSAENLCRTISWNQN
jgi:hypothetical protein